MPSPSTDRAPVSSLRLLLKVASYPLALWSTDLLRRFRRDECDLIKTVAVNRIYHRRVESDDGFRFDQIRTQILRRNRVFDHHSTSVEAWDPMLLVPSTRTRFFHNVNDPQTFTVLHTPHREDTISRIPHRETRAHFD